MPATTPRRRILGPLVGLAILGLTAGVAAAGGASHASARIVNGSNETIGWARFTEDARGLVHVNVKVAGLTPGLHGIHIHSTGTCTPFSAAGPHYNPAPTHEHGLDNPDGAHAGDLPNLAVNVAGQGRLTGTTDRVTLTAETTTLFDSDGSAVVIHMNPDDQVTDATNGNSGARIACGIIVAD